MVKKIVSAGRLKDRDETTTLTSIHVDNETLKWIDENTIGNKQLVYNYLLKAGINSLRDVSEPAIIESLMDQSIYSEK